jgi:hypothetical protein
MTDGGTETYARKLMLETSVHAGQKDIRGQQKHMMRMRVASNAEPVVATAAADNAAAFAAEKANAAASGGFDFACAASPLDTAAAADHGTGSPSVFQRIFTKRK